MKHLLFVLILSISGSFSVFSQDNNYVHGEIIVMLKSGETTSKLVNSFGFMNLIIQEQMNKQP